MDTGMIQKHFTRLPHTCGGLGALHLFSMCQCAFPKAESATHVTRWSQETTHTHYKKREKDKWLLKCTPPHVICGHFKSPTYVTHQMQLCVPCQGGVKIKNQLKGICRQQQHHIPGFLLVMETFPPLKEKVANWKKKNWKGSRIQLDQHLASLDNYANHVFNFFWHLAEHGSSFTHKHALWELM